MFSLLIIEKYPLPKSDIKRWFLSTPVMEATFSPYVDGIWRNLLVSALNTFSPHHPFLSIYPFRFVLDKGLIQISR